MRPDADFTARVGPIEFTGAPLDYEKNGWYVEDVTGLNSGVSVTPDEQPRDQGEGQHDLPNRIDEARTIGIRGIAYAHSMWELGKMSREQGALLALPKESGAFTWLEFGEWFTTDVRRGPGWDFRRRGDTGIAEFQVRFRAPSQTFYGVTAESASGTDVYVTNRGLIPSAPVLTITGNMPGGYTIYGPTGRVFQVTATLAPGSVDVIDMRGDGVIFRNGSPLVGAYGSRLDMWTIPAGATQNQVLAPAAGTGQMAVEVFPAFF